MTSSFRLAADTAVPDDLTADAAIIGGSGLYSLLEDAAEVAVDTPFGEPSDAVTLGRFGGRRVAFLPRHGRDHRFPPHRVNYRANLWALRRLGARTVLAPCAVGSLLPELGPGTLVVPDQVLDRTWGRDHTYYDGPGSAVHVPFADPYCPRWRAALVAAASRTGWQARDGATLVVVNGPRFSSRAESRWHAAAGGHLVGMTGMPEAALARELALCYAAVAVVTDLDAGVASGEGVTQGEVFEVFGRSVARLRGVLEAALAGSPPGDCTCRHALDGLHLPFPLP